MSYDLRIWKLNVESPTEPPSSSPLNCGYGCPDGGSHTFPENPAIERLQNIKIKKYFLIHACSLHHKSICNKQLRLTSLRGSIKSILIRNYSNFSPTSDLCIRHKRYKVLIWISILKVAGKTQDHPYEKETPELSLENTPSHYFFRIPCGILNDGLQNPA